MKIAILSHKEVANYYAANLMQRCHEITISGGGGIPRATFHRWYDRFLTDGVEALEDRPPRPGRVAAHTLVE